jgi:predicted nucleic acid-binding protein
MSWTRGRPQPSRWGVSLRADLVLVDEVRARAVARRLGLAVLGTIGLLAMAKRQGLIPAARPLIALVRSRGGLWVTDNLVAEVLARLDE